MTSHEAELSRNMDRITQLQDGIDNLVTIMYSTISFLSRKAEFKQVNPDIPITQSIPESNQPEGTQETFTQNCEELVADFMRKAKQIEYLISILPPNPDTNQKNSKNGILSNEIGQKSSSSPSSGKSPQLDQTLNQVSTDPIDNLQKQADDGGNKEVESKQNFDSDREEFESLKKDIHAAQAEYDQALALAKALHSEVQAALRKILDERAEALANA